MGCERPSLESRREVVEGFAAELRERGPVTFLHGDGDALFAHGDHSHHDFGSIRPPGLWRQQRHCPADEELVTADLRIEA